MKQLIIAIIATAILTGCNAPSNNNTAKPQEAKEQTVYTSEGQQQDTTSTQVEESSNSEYNDNIIDSLRSMEGLLSEKGNKRIFRRVVSHDFEYDTLITEYPPGCLQKMPENIVEYLESKNISSFYGENDGYIFSKKHIIELQKYKDGKRKFFPTEEVQEAINYFSSSLCDSYHYNDILCTDTLQNLLYEFTDIAINLVPDINLISNICSSDHRIGFINDYGSHNEGFFCYSIIYKTKEGKHKAYTLDIVDRGAPLTTIRKITEEKGKATYIISVEKLHTVSRAYYTPFVLYVVELFDNGIVKSYKPTNSEKNITEWLALYIAEDEKNTYHHSKVVFNPQKLSWEICYKDNNVYQKIPRTKTLQLDFSGNTPTLILK